MDFRTLIREKINREAKKKGFRSRTEAMEAAIRGGFPKGLTTIYNIMTNGSERIGTILSLCKALGIDGKKLIIEAVKEVKE